MIREEVQNEHPDDDIVEVKYKDDGIEVFLKSGEKIKIGIDWKEINLIVE